MSLSDSGDLSTPGDFPPDKDIEECLRRIVREATKDGEEVTINLARTRAETELGLDVGFFKDTVGWKQRSKDVINAAFEEPDSPRKPKKAVSGSKPAVKAGTKRKSDEAQAGSKRARKSPVVDSEDNEEPTSEADAATLKSQSANDKDTSELQTKSAEDSALSEPPEDESEPEALKTNGKAEVDDDSDLSSVVDSGPPKKGRKKKSNSASATKSKPSKAVAAKSKPAKPDKPATELSPDEEEIKRLQSWLLKCGIRKLWHRELAPYPTAKEKIKHLKQMLDDVGMTGRFSAEKARQIKESRELAAELEAAKEFNQQWGQKGEGEEDSDEENQPDGSTTKERAAPPRRLKPKGLVDFGDSGDESDR